MEFSEKIAITGKRSIRVTRRFSTKVVMSQKVAEVIVSTLKDAGARRCYGVPGDTLNHITDAIRRSGIRFVHVRHEEVGGFAAGADAVLTGDLALCAGSCGPAHCTSSMVSWIRIGAEHQWF